ncbi:MAG: hypothetical protein Q9196_004993 [Gyalolechia fulgens]
MISQAATAAGSTFISPIPVLLLQSLLCLALGLLFLMACHFGGRCFARCLTRPAPQKPAATPRSFPSALLSPFRYVCSLPKIIMGFDPFVTAYFAYCIWAELAYPPPYGANNYILTAVRFLILGPLITLFRPRGQLMKDIFHHLNGLFHCCYALVAWCKAKGPACGFAVLVLVDDAHSVASKMLRWSRSTVKVVFWILRWTFSTVLVVGLTAKIIIGDIWHNIYIRPRLEAAVGSIEASHKEELRKRDEQILQLADWQAHAVVREREARSREADARNELDTLRAVKWALSIPNPRIQAGYALHEQITQLTQTTFTHPAQQREQKLAVAELEIREIGGKYRWLEGKYGKLEEDSMAKDEMIKSKDEELTRKNDTIMDQDNTIQCHQLREKTLANELAESKSTSLSRQAQVDKLTKQLETQAKSSQEELATAAAKLVEANTKLEEEKDSRAKETARANKAVTANEACHKAKSDVEKKLAAVEAELSALKASPVVVEGPMDDEEDTMDVDDAPESSAVDQELLAQVKYMELLPYGHEPQNEPQIERFFGGFVAIADSMRLQGHPAPSFDTLREFFSQNRDQINAGIAKPVEFGPLHPDQLARLVRFWGESQGLLLRLGVVTNVLGQTAPLVNFDDVENETPGLRTVCLFKYITENTLEATLKAPWRALAPLPEPSDNSAEMNEIAEAKFLESFPKGYGVRKQGDSGPHESGFDALRASIQFQQPGLQVSNEGLVSCYDKYHAQGELTKRDQNANLTYEQMYKLCLFWGDDQSKNLVLGVVLRIEGREKHEYRLASNFDVTQTDQKIIWLIKKAENESVDFDEMIWQGLAPKMK